MFDNISQGIFTTGAIGYLIVVPLFRSLAILFMAISTYKLLKARQDNHTFLWILAICISPIISRIAFEVYRGCIVRKESDCTKGSKPFLVASIIAFVLSIIFMVVSVISMGVGFIKSEVDDEPLVTVSGRLHLELFDFVE